MYKGFYEDYFHTVEEFKNEEDFNEEDFCFDFLQDTCDAFHSEELNRINLEKYLHGYCNEFAIMLSKKYGYEIICVYNGGQLIHAYCVHNEMYIDVRGVTDDFDFFMKEFQGDFVSTESTYEKHFSNYMECFYFFKTIGMDVLENQDELGKIYRDEYTNNYYAIV